MTSAQTSKKYGVSVTVLLCPFALYSTFSAKSFIRAKYAYTGTTLSIQKVQPQLHGTSARPPVQHDYLQQKELDLVLPESSWLVCMGRTWFQQGSAKTTPYHAHTGRRHRCNSERERSKLCLFDPLPMRCSNLTCFTGKIKGTSRTALPSTGALTLPCDLR